MTNPVDEYFLEKEAFGLSPKLRDVAQSSAVQFGVGAALMAAPAAAQKIYQAATKRHNYNMMLEQNPELVGARAENPTQFNNYYNSLHRLNPTFAADPIVGGTYMRQMMNNPEAAGKVIVESMRAFPTPSTPTFGEAWRTGAGAAAKSFGKGLERPDEQDPFAAQEQRVRGLGLDVKEHELSQKKQGFEEAKKQQGLFGR